MFNGDELTDQQYDIADRLELALEAEPSGLTPSAAARLARTDYRACVTVLQWMVRQRFARTGGNGAWTRYYARNLPAARQAGGAR